MCTSYTVKGLTQIIINEYTIADSTRVPEKIPPGTDC